MTHVNQVLGHYLRRGGLGHLVALITVSLSACTVNPDLVQIDKIPYGIRVTNKTNGVLFVKVSLYNESMSGACKFPSVAVSPKSFINRSAESHTTDCDATIAGRVPHDYEVIVSREPWSQSGDPLLQHYRTSGRDLGAEPWGPLKVFGLAYQALLIILVVVLILFGFYAAPRLRKGTWFGKRRQSKKAAEVVNAKPNPDQEVVNAKPDSDQKEQAGLQSGAPGGGGWRPKDPPRSDQPPGIPSGDLVVSGFAASSELFAGPKGGTTTTTVWRFRLERYDREGNRLSVIPVEMRANSFKGFVNDGDRVELYDKWREGELLQTTKLRNLTTGAMVEANEPSSLVVVVVVIGIFGFLLLLFFLSLAFLSGPQKPYRRHLRVDPWFDSGHNSSLRHPWQMLPVASSLASSVTSSRAPSS